VESVSLILAQRGTGTFGNAILRRFLDTEIGEIRIFSRDEKKHDEMRNALRNPKVKFYLGDVREYDTILPAMRDVDMVFHAAPATAMLWGPAVLSFPFS
jgi:UDP-N-acetylglucosamine 4,6-dehydratase